MSPFAYSSLVVSRGSPQIAFTWFVVMPTRGVLVAGRAGVGDCTCLGGGDALPFAAASVTGIAPSESNSHGKFW